VTELHPLDVPPEVAEHIRRLSHTELSAQGEAGIWARLERDAVRWIEPPLVGVFASGLLVWAVAVVSGPITL
jgi:hypothetical protein